MVDITAKLFWYRTKEWYDNMADKLNDFVYTDDSKETVDVINLLLLGWILLGLIVYIIGNVIANQLRKRKSTFPPHETESADEKSEPTEHVSCEIEVKSTAEEILKEPEKVLKSVVIPTCYGDEEEIVEWINNVFSWMYNQRVISPVLDSWLSALNARTRLLSTEHGILVDFKEVTHTSGPPVIAEALEICTSKGDLNVIYYTDIEDVQFEITVTQFKEKDKIIIPFILNLKRLSGKVNVECTPEDLIFVAKFSESPQVELSAEPINVIEHKEDSQPLCNLVCEITTEALSSSIVDFKFSCYPECPRLLLKSTASEEELFEAAEDESEEQLLVKIIKATNLGGSQGCFQPYCVVEMDDPPQRFETQALDEKHNPFWDESFTFSVKDASAELLFEIYDKGKPSTENFLGLGIVSVDELIKNPSQRQIIPLQSRPLEDDDVTGSLTTEFLFLNKTTPVSETTHLSQFTATGNGVANSGKTVETNSRVTAGGTVITTTTIKRTKEENSGRPEVTSNLNANSNSIHSAEHSLTSLHEVKQEQLQKKNNSKNEPNVGSNTKDMNGNCSIYAVNDPSTNHINHKNYSNAPETVEYKLYSVNEQNGFILNKNHDSNKNAEGENISQNILYSENKFSVVNGASDFINPTMHVHVDPSTPTILVGDSNENPVNGSLTSNSDKVKDGIELKGASEMHEISENVENSVHLSRDTDSSSTDMSSTLPPIAETIEVSSTSSKGLENDKDAEADLTGTALKELEKHSKPSSTSKSTLIIHSVQRQADSSISESLEASPASHMSKDSRTSYSESATSSPSQDRSGDDRSRPKEKKTFMGSLRRRLSFRKPRSKSAENRSESASNYSHGSSRSASTDRIRHPLAQKPSPFKGKFMGMKHLAVPGSTRSSLSEASGISASSSRTYINENSTLVIETNENGIIKRYLIPNSLVHRSKWKKRGIKLHIYNDHVFVAKHLSGSTTCQVCQKYLTRRPGKQGYECRGCNLQCHKSCHVKVATFCSNSTINSMEVEYIHDPRGATPKSI